MKYYKIKSVCSWCNDVYGLKYWLRDTKPIADKTHGICAKCLNNRKETKGQ